MATDKLFTVVGVSTLDGETKVRFANDIMRVKVLDKHNHTDIRLIEMPQATSKLEAAKFIQGLDEFQDAVAQAAIADYLDRNDEKPAKAPKAKVEIKEPKAKAPKAKKEKAPAVADEADDDQPIGYAELEAAVGEAPF